MNLEPRIRGQLKIELQGATATSGLLDSVIARGRRRRLAYRTSQALAVAAAMVLAVATTALIVNAMASSRLVASPITGTELPVISDSPLVLRAQPEPMPDGFVPEGTEIVLEPIDKLLPDEALTLATELGDSNAPIVAIGEVDGRRLFAVQGTELRLVLFAAFGSFSTQSELNPSLSAGPSATQAVGQPPPQTAFGLVAFDGDAYWQRPVEGLILMPYAPPPTGGGMLVMYDETGAVLDEHPIGETATWIDAVGLEQMDPVVWEGRLERACTEGVWDQQVATRLASEFIAEDLGTVERRPSVGDPTPEAGAYALWLMSVRYCREAFPPGTAETPWSVGDAAVYGVPPPGTIDDWVNSLGLLQTDEQVWAARLTRACDAGVWDLFVAEQLATEFIAEDLELSAGGEGAPAPTTRQGAQALWRMTVQYCREAFPPGEIEAGPFMTSALEGVEDAIANRDPWDEVAAAPIAGRYAHASAWTGEHVLIWGGIHKPSDPEPSLADGARYHPQQNLWRMLPPAPEGMSGPARSVWTGSKWIVRTDQFPDGPLQMASYDPTADRWAQIDVGRPGGQREGYAMVWTGEEVIFYGGTIGDLLPSVNPTAYNPATEAWRELPAPPIGQRTSPAAVWTGNELIIWGGKTSCSPDGDSTCTEFAADGAAYDPATNSWRVLADNGELPADSPVSGWAWTGTELLILYTEECDDGTCLTGHALHVARNEWRRMPDLGGAAFLSNPPVWTESDGFRSLLYLWDRTGAGFSYHAVDDKWVSLGQYPMTERFGATVVPVGPQVFVWGGWDGAAANDPFDDGFMTIP